MTDAKPTLLYIDDDEAAARLAHDLEAALHAGELGQGIEHGVLVFTGRDGKFGNYDPKERAEVMKDPAKAAKP